MVSVSPGRCRNGHPRRGGFPHQANLFRRQAVGLVDEVADFGFQLQGFGRQLPGGVDRPGAFVPKGLSSQPSVRTVSVLDLPLQEPDFVVRQVEELDDAIVQLVFGIGKLPR